MVKVSITLPNSAQITFESEEPEVIHDVVVLALRDLPRELMFSTLLANGGNTRLAPLEKGTGVTETPAPPQPPETNTLATPPARETARGRTPAVGAPSSGTRPSRRGPHKSADSEQPETPQSARSPTTEKAFAEFCRSANPLGDMRRVVVATEAARLFFGMESVDGTELARLFDLADWRQPHSFTQTLRNAARDKFRWLERMPGRTGRYTATALGRAITLDE